MFTIYQNIKFFRETIRQVDKEFKLLVDNSAITYHQLRVELMKNSSEDAVEISLRAERSGRNEKHVAFCHNPAGYLVSKRNGNEKIVKVAKNGTEFPFIDRAALHLTKILKNPKLTFEKLRIKFHPPNTRNNESRLMTQFELRKEVFMRKLKETLVQLNHQLQVESLEIDIGGTEDDILAVLQSLQAKTLKTIILGDTFRTNGFHGPTKDLEVGRIVQTDQWKEAKALWTDKYVVSQPFSTWSHFDKLNVHVRSLTLEVFKNMLQVSRFNQPEKNANSITDLRK